MRPLSAGVLFLFAGFGAGACGALSGLSDYETGPVPDGGFGHPLDARTVTSSEGGDDMESASLDDGSPGDEAGDSAADDSPAIADADIPDVDPDAAPACGTMTCGGCCANGTCHGGASVATCGKGGGACSDCTSMGACSADGTCAKPVVDAGPAKTCNASQCHVACIPVYQGPCCKSDETCGCQVVIPSRGSCG